MNPAHANAINEGASFLESMVRYHTMDEKGVPAETCVACAAWMAGTQLFRMHVHQELNLPSGSVVLSEEVNVRLPSLSERIARSVNKKTSIEGFADGRTPANTSIPIRLSLAQAQDLLDPIYLSYAHRSAFSQEDALEAAVQATIIAAEKAQEALGPAMTIYIAQRSMLEASKTAARKVQPVDISPRHLKPFASLLPRQPLWQRLVNWVAR